MADFRIGATTPFIRPPARFGAFESRSMERLQEALPAHAVTVVELGHLRAPEIAGAHRRQLVLDGVIGDPATASVFLPATGIPLPDASQDLLVAAHLFERLRMDELYMVCHEARRVVKTGGHWLLLGLCPGTGWRESVGKIARLCQRRGPALVLTHYISPEDWEIERDETFAVGWLSAQLLRLRRLPG